MGTNRTITVLAAAWVGGCYASPDLHDADGVTSFESEATADDTKPATEQPDAGSDETARGGSHAGRIVHRPHRPVCKDAGLPVPPPSSCGWTTYSDGLSGANVSGVLYDPRGPGVAYATSGATVWRSDDHGTTWEARGSVPEGSFVRLAVAGAAEQLLAATTSGVARSTDGGGRWSALSLDGLALSALAVAPSSPLQVFAAADGAGVLRSRDGGLSWVDVSYGYPYGATVSISVHPNAPDSVVTAVRTIGAGGGYLDDGAVLLSVDAGASWTTVLGGRGFVSAVERCPANADVLVAAGRDGIHRSDDAGHTWRTTSLDGVRSWVYGVAFSGTGCDDFYALHAGIGPRRTHDGGLTFAAAEVSGLDMTFVGTFPGQMALDPTRAGTALLGTHAGLYGRSAEGAAWTQVPSLFALPITGLATSDADPGALWVTTWGAGTWLRAAGAPGFARVPASRLPADYAAVVAVSPSDGRRVLVGTQAGLFASDDGESFERQAVAANPQALAFGPDGSEWVATQIDGVWSHTSASPPWTARNGALAPWATAAGTFIDIQSLAISPRNAARMFAGSNGRGLLRSTNAGGDWETVLEPTGRVRCVIASTVVPGTIYACVRGVQRSVDDGATWSDDSRGLPSLDVAALVEDPATGDVYATTAQGVYVLRDGAPWAGVDTSCLGSAGAATILRAPGGPRLVVAGGGSIVTRTLPR